MGITHGLRKAGNGKVPIAPRCLHNDLGEALQKGYPNLRIRQELERVERKGIEPSTSALRTLRSPN
jgi:hypothetical protein